MTKRFRFLLLLLAVGTLGVLVFVFHPQAEEVEHTEPPPVSESDLQMYIKVYTAMQDDHDLTIEEAIKPYNISLDDFRQIERRIQAESTARRAGPPGVAGSREGAFRLRAVGGAAVGGRRRRQPVGRRKPKKSHSEKGDHK